MSHLILNFHQFLIKIGNFPRNQPATICGIHTSNFRFGDNVENALKVKEAPQVDNKVVLTPKVLEQKQKLNVLITVSEKYDITKISGVPLEHTKGIHTQLPLRAYIST